MNDKDKKVRWDLWAGVFDARRRRLEEMDFTKYSFDEEAPIPAKEKGPTDWDRLVAERETAALMKRLLAA
jgi:hypothetical protein